MILICYDGSADARAAIAEAGRVLSGHPAIVLTVWPPVAELMARTPAGMGLMAGIGDSYALDDTSREGAERAAAEGVELARQAGFDASARTVPQIGTVADTILDQADAVNATAIVMGSRGRTGLKSLLLGSVSHGVVQRADRAVLVTPSPAVAAERHERLQRTSDGED